MRLGRLVIALLAGAVVTLVVYQASIERVRDESEVPVVVAGSDIPSRTLVTRDLVRETSMPRRLVPSGAIASVTEVQDRILRDPVYAGQVIVDKHVAARGAELSASLLIPAGKAYAFNLPMSLFFAPAPRLQVHDRIDIIAYPRGRPVSEGGPILTNIEIIDLSPKQTDNVSESAFLTVAVTADEIVRVLAMRDAGQAFAVAVRPFAR
jgi:Flp pilus assembly protein CpaB